MFVQKLLSGLTGIFLGCLHDSWTKDQIRARVARDYAHLFSNYKRNISVWKLPILILSQETKKVSPGKISVRGVLIQVRYSRLSFFSRGPRAPYCSA